MLSVNSGLVALFGFLQEGKAVPDAAGKQVWLLAIPVAGALVWLAWIALLASYRSLNRAKFTVLMEMEQGLPVPLFAHEREIYKKDGRRPLSRIESWIPWCFVVLYAVLVVADLAI